LAAKLQQFVDTSKKFLRNDDFMIVEIPDSVGRIEDFMLKQFADGLSLIALKCQHLGYWLITQLGKLM
jgi:hypothetical protein